MEEFERDMSILEDEFVLEFQEMTKTHKRQVKELHDMIDTVKEEEKKKAEDAKNDHQTFREDTKNKNLEEINHMKMLLDAR